MAPTLPVMPSAAIVTRKLDMRPAAADSPYCLRCLVLQRRVSCQGLRQHERTRSHRSGNLRVSWRRPTRQPCPLLGSDAADLLRPGLRLLSGDAIHAPLSGVSWDVLPAAVQLSPGV